MNRKRWFRKKQDPIKMPAMRSVLELRGWCWVDT